MDRIEAVSSPNHALQRNDAPAAQSDGCWKFLTAPCSRRERSAAVTELGRHTTEGSWSFTPMLRWFIRRRLDAEEKTLGASLDYLRYILDVSPAAFLRFASMIPFANSRSVLPKEAWFVAQIVTLLHEDCGPCLQIAINLARQSGVDTTLIRAVLDGSPNDLPREMEDVRQFTNCVLRPSGDEDTFREQSHSTDCKESAGIREELQRSNPEDALICGTNGRIATASAGAAVVRVFAWKANSRHPVSRVV